MQSEPEAPNSVATATATATAPDPGDAGFPRAAPPKSRPDEPAASVRPSITFMNPAQKSWRKQTKQRM